MCQLNCIDLNCHPNQLPINPTNLLTTKFKVPVFFCNMATHEALCHLIPLARTQKGDNDKPTWPSGEIKLMFCYLLCAQKNEYVRFALPLCSAASEQTLSITQRTRERDYNLHNPIEWTNNIRAPAISGARRQRNGSYRACAYLW